MTQQAEETTRNYAHEAAMQKKMPALPIEVRGVSAQGHPRLKPNLSYSFCSVCVFFVFVFFSPAPAVRFASESLGRNSE